MKKMLYDKIDIIVLFETFLGDNSTPTHYEWNKEMKWPVSK